MRKLQAVLTISMLCISLAAHASDTKPQTARQALLEMFFSKESGTLVKHLPAATRAVLEKSGAFDHMQQYSLLMAQYQSQGKNFQTFETGSILLATENPQTGQKIDITVVNDTQRGNQDDIELSIQTYKNGQPERTPFMPHMIFSMKNETSTWKLYEVSLTIHLPLADPDLLKSITDGMKARSSATATAEMHPQIQIHQQIQPQIQNASQSFGTDAQVTAAMRTILTAEGTYAGTYRATGFTCTLSDLDGFGGGDPNEHQAMLINSGLASGKKYGYVFQLSGCVGAPAHSFSLTATPNGEGFGRRAFCSDQRAIIRSSDDGNPATCLASGTPVQ